MSVNSKMRAIADAVRSLFLYDDDFMLGLDEMAGYVGFAKQCIDNALVSVKNKGVTVPDNSAIMDLPALIDSIPTEGGGGASIDTCTLQLNFPQGLIYYSYIALDSNGTVTPMTMIYHNLTEAASYTFTNAVPNSYVILTLYTTKDVRVSGSGERVMSYKDNADCTIQVIEIHGDCVISPGE